MMRRLKAMSTTVLATGGAGFIGSHLVRQLLSRGESVRVLDNLATGHLANLEAVRDDIDFRIGDLRNPDDCLTACRDTVVLQYFNVFGPRQDPNSACAAVIPKFVSAILDGRRPVIHGDGQQSRDFTYVANVVTANLLVGAAPDAPGNVFNVACGEQIALADALTQIAALLVKEARPWHEESRPGDVRRSRADISRLGKLGYRPRVRFAKGLAETVEWFRRSHQSRSVAPPRLEMAVACAS
jgi:nucleoside-diphosphate-sugar epimerase